MNYDEIMRNLEYTIKEHKDKFVGTFETNIYDMARDCKRFIEWQQKEIEAIKLLAEDSKRCFEWVETTERLPVKEDAGIDGMVAFCDRDEWDCFNRLEKWDEIKPQKHTYWHKMLKAPEVENDKG